ncbi:MAG: hypothetical protein EA355_15865 [Rhodobacteraceae bacterium]|nr:MAG: hypothetical protein EA355_15865 [Paracoccaceae bacterium]
MSGAKRFGGAHSPGGHATRGASPWAGRRVASPSLGALGLFFWPIPFLAGAFSAMTRGDAVGMVWLGVCYLALLLGAHLTRTGLTAAAAYEARAVARPPAIPRKLFGAALTALGVGLGALRATGSVAESALFAMVAASLHVVAFGPDPMRAKGVDGLSGDALDDAVTRIETARALIAEMTEAAAGFGDRALTDRVARLAADAGRVVAQLEQAPGKLRRARRFLTIYLVGARDATVKAAQAWAEKPDPETRASYDALLDDLERAFATHADALGDGDRAALDVEIEVLRDRLKLEGV